MNKTRCVLELQEIVPQVLAGGYARFTYNDPEWSRQTQVNLDLDVWYDMDGPEKITVTIRPGDKLNVDQVGS